MLSDLHWDLSVTINTSSKRYIFNKSINPSVINSLIWINNSIILKFFHWIICLDNWQIIKTCKILFVLCILIKIYVFLDIRTKLFRIYKKLSSDLFFVNTSYQLSRTNIICNLLKWKKYFFLYIFIKNKLLNDNIKMIIWFEIFYTQFITASYFSREAASLEVLETISWNAIRV